MITHPVGRGVRLELLAGVALFVAVPLLAQEKLEPPQREGTSVDSVSSPTEEKLPQIDLPEFQITGKERIDLPEFSKSAAEDDRGLGTLLDERGPGQREMPEFGFGGRVKDQIGFDSVSRGLNGRLTAGYGSFNTPFFDGWFGQTGSSVDFLLKAGYKSSKGHIANADHRNGYSEISCGWDVPGNADILAGARLDALVGMHGDGYRLYGSAVPERKRTINRFRTDVALQSSIEDLFDYSGGVRLQGVTMTDSIHSREASLGFDLSAERQEGKVRLIGDAAFWSDFYNAPSVVSNPYLFRVGTRGIYRVSDRIDLAGGLALSFFRGSDNDGKTRLLPTLGVSWYPVERITVFARFESSVERRTLGTLAEQNPYIVNDVVIRHEERPVYLTGGGEVEINRGTRARLSVDYTLTRSFPLYSDDADSGLWRPDYEGLTRILAARFEVQAEFDGSHTISSSLVLQGARNSVTETSPAYFPSVTLSGIYQYRFPFGLTTGGIVNVVGQQSVDRENTRTMPAFALVDLTASYTVTSGLTLTGTLRNLFNSSYSWWEGYLAQPRGVVVSLSHDW